VYRANTAKLAVDKEADERPREVNEVTRTVVVRSEQLPKRIFRIFVELEGMYRNIVEQLVLYAVNNGITKFTRLKAEKYRELRSLYPQLPSHYIYTASRNDSKSFSVSGLVSLSRSGTIWGNLSSSMKSSGVIMSLEAVLSSSSSLSSSFKVLSRSISL